MAQKYVFIQDPGHGWIIVTLAEIARLGIADQISSYSYKNVQAGEAYLEEDCDAALFIRAKEALGEAFAFRDVHTDSDAKCRTLPRFH